MPTVRCTSNMYRHVDCADANVSGRSVAEALHQYFVSFPGARDYLLDDQGAVRHHMVVFVDGQPLRDRQHLSDELGEHSEVFIFQALSGG